MIETPADAISPTGSKPPRPLRRRGVWLISLLVVVLGGWGYQTWRAERAEKETWIWWRGGAMEICTASETPVRVTHLMAVYLYSTPQTSIGRVAIARLPEPLVFVRPTRRKLESAIWRQYDWRDTQGVPVPPPPERVAMFALYDKPMVTHYTGVLPVRDW